MPDDTTQGAALAGLMEAVSGRIVAHLAKNATFTADAEIALADLIEADFPGYAAIRLPEPEIFITEIEEYAESYWPGAVWEAGPIVDAQLITGCYVTIDDDDGVPHLSKIVILDPPVYITEEGQKINPGIRFLSVAELD